MSENRIPVSLTINGSRHHLYLEARRTLLDVIREDIGLTGTKKVCDMGNCGACTVSVDGKTMYSCLLLAVDCTDREITTIEGIAQQNDLDPVQEAFIRADAFQCGFCTPGQIMSARALLDANPNPTDEEIRHAMGGNLCRCGAYQNIVKAVHLAAELRAQRASQPQEAEVRS